MPKIIKRQIEGLKKLKDLDFQQRLLFLYTHPNIKEILLSDITTHSVKQIVEQYSLITEQHEIISQVIGKILTGQSSSDKLQESLSKTLNLAPEIIQDIAKQINEKIFAPIKQELDQAYREAMTPDFVKKPESETPTENRPLTPNQQVQSAPVIPAAPAVSAPNLTSEPEAIKPQSPPLAAAPPANLPTAENSLPANSRSEARLAPTEPKQYATPTANLQDIRTLAKQNPQVLDQPITAGPLQEFGTGNSIAPTVRNWLLDYAKVAGAGQHSSLDRGRYLFKSPNAKNLSEAERLFLSQVLESYDEGLPVKTDSPTKLLAIPKYDPSPKTQRSDDVRTFKIQPVSFNNIVDLQDI